MEALLVFVVAVIIIGVALYLVQLIPMNATLKQVLTVIVLAAVIIYALLNLVPLIPHLLHTH